MVTIALIAILTLATSFTCSLLEAVLYSVTPSQLAVLRERKARGARRLTALRQRMEEPIAAILTVNTIAHTFGAAGCGALVAQQFGDAALGIFTGVFTLAVLLLTEIVPKSLGVHHAVRLVGPTAVLLQIMTWTVWPLARVASAMMRRFHGRASGAPSAEEVLAMSRLAAHGGRLGPQEMRWIENALHLDQVTARSVMTPRTVVQSVEAGRTAAEIVADPEQVTHSRLPVLENGEVDRLLGVAYRRDLFDAVVDGQGHRRIRDLMKPIDYVPFAATGRQLLDRFIREKRHIVAVLDEYGGFAGIVTLEDVLEQMLGDEIVDEHDRAPDLQEFARTFARLQHPEDAGDTGEAAADGTPPPSRGRPAD